MARTPQNTGPNPLAVNAASRNLLLNNAVERVTGIYDQNISPSTQSVVNISPRNAGLLRGFIVRVTGTLNNSTAASTASRTELGGANALSQIVFTDLQNNNRVQAPGWYLTHLAALKQGYSYGGAYAPNVDANYGNVFTVQSLPSTLAANTDATLVHHYWVPVSYGAEDLRGAIYMGVVQATANLQLTINTTPSGVTGDTTLCLYSGAGTGVTWKSGTTIRIQVWQVYYDQIPTGQDGSVILPMWDLSHIYDIRTTTLTGMASGADFPIEYANLRAFLSTTLVYNNGGTLNSGSDINYFSLQSANVTELWRYDPQLAALFMRSEIMSDAPKGVYSFSHRRRPLETVQYGNMQLIVNPAGTVNSGAQFWLGYESFILRNQVTLAGSIPGGG
jgi:hypothetical protein